MLSDRSKLFAKKFLIQAFEYLDSDKNGFLEKEELRTVLKGADCSELSCILEELDSNDDDRISLEEFIHYLRNENSWSWFYHECHLSLASLLSVDNNIRTDWSGVDDEEDHDDENEEEDDYCANLAHVIGFEEFSQFGLDEVEFFSGVIDIGVKIFNEMSLLIEFGVDLSSLFFQAFGDIADFIEGLILFFKLLFLVGLHLNSNYI